MADILDRMSRVQEALVNEKTAKSETLAPAPDGKADEDRYHDKVNALAGIKFEQKLPVIKDTDMDLKRHLREFQARLNMHSFGRRAVRPIDRWTLYKQTLQENGIRWKIYCYMDRKATRLGRLPGEAQAVFEETVEAQKERLKETALKKKERVDDQFYRLSMKGKTHAEFRVAFEDAIEDFEDAEMDVPTAENLHRKYLAKLSDDLREAVMNKLWPLDGEGTPPRKPTTWQEVGDACEMEISTRLETQKVGDTERVYGLDEGGAK